MKRMRRGNDLRKRRLFEFHIFLSQKLVNCFLLPSSFATFALITPTERDATCLRCSVLFGFVLFCSALLCRLRNCNRRKTTFSSPQFPKNKSISENYSTLKAANSINAQNSHEAEVLVKLCLLLIDGQAALPRMFAC